ncbi:MAG: 5-carboxymethyl-2-hydroxymuconate Delta-isomerase [Gammaproteobacteria bacterium]|nr:5-carboxymethyl-2-hydroxymuconate Delta-isomerase [Gammaproteobacteria bacterium]
MPHQIIEYSANLDAFMDVDALLKALHETAKDIDALPTGGIRTRAVSRRHYAIADGHPDNAFINVTLRVAEGRTLETRQQVGERLFKTLCDFVAPIFAEQPLSLSYEIQEIKPDTRWKHSNIRDHMARRANDAGQ